MLSAIASRPHQAIQVFVIRMGVFFQRPAKSHKPITPTPGIEPGYPYGPAFQVLNFYSSFELSKFFGLIFPGLCDTITRCGLPFRVMEEFYIPPYAIWTCNIEIINIFKVL